MQSQVPRQKLYVLQTASRKKKMRVHMSIDIVKTILT